MTIEEKIRVLLARRGISQSELARRLGTTASNLNQKIKRDTLTLADLRRIAEVTDCVWEANFVLEDGFKI